MKDRKHLPQARGAAKGMEARVQRMLSGAQLDGPDHFPPALPAVDEEDVVEDPLVGSEPKSFPPHCPIHHSIVRVNGLARLEPVDRVPLGIAHVAVGYGLPVSMAKDAGGEIKDNMVWDEVIVGHDVGRKVAKVTEDERMSPFIVSEGHQPLLDVPVVAMVPDASVGFEIDDVRGDVSVEKRQGVPEDEALLRIYFFSSPKSS